LAFDEQIIVGREELRLEPERTVLVGIEDYAGASRSAMQELLQLVRAAGASVVDVITQIRSKPHQATYVGKGKLEEIREAVKANEADMVVFNATLRPAQINNILDVLEEWKVLDRVELILDVFAQHARSREGKLQVELAQLTYLLPRLVGYGKMMSRIGGGRPATAPSYHSSPPRIGRGSKPPGYRAGGASPLRTADNQYCRLR